MCASVFLESESFLFSGREGKLRIVSFLGGRRNSESPDEIGPMVVKLKKANVAI